MTTSIDLTKSTPTQIVQDAATQLNTVISTLQKNTTAVAALSATDQTAIENALTAIGVDLNAVSTALATSSSTSAASGTTAPSTVTAGQAAALAIGTLVVGGLVVWGITSMTKGKHHEGGGTTARENPIRRRRRR